MTPEPALQFSLQTIYLMGFSFILGSLVTIVILTVLDMIRRLRPEWTEELREREAYDAQEDDDAAQ